MFSTTPVVQQLVSLSQADVTRERLKESMETVTAQETKRFMIAKGQSGAFFVRVCDSWKTSFHFSAGGIFNGASRVILRMNNIALFRGPVDDSSLTKVMVGPTAFLGTLTDIHKKAFQIQINDGIPTFRATSYTLASELGKQAGLQPLTNHDALILADVTWFSGKSNDKSIKSFLKGKFPDTVASLTADLGVLVLPSKHIEVPYVDARHSDIAEFGAKLVNNEQPFTLTRKSEDNMDAVIYRFGQDYAKSQIENGNGIFLETHDFTQIMTPLTAASAGFITLGRKTKLEGKEVLQLIGVQVPFGHSIIIEPGAIHGDATFVGHYAMAMTVNHRTMASADVFFLRDDKDNRVTLTCKLSDTVVADETSAEKNNLAPLLLPNNGEFAKEFKQKAYKVVNETPRTDRVLFKTFFTRVKSIFNT
ncbi:MAG: hypothetical protein ACPGUD_11055 [Parashewanella sp.]